MTEIKNKDILVTGGAGFIGSNLVEKLATENNVTVLDNMHTGSEKNLIEAMKTGNVKLIKEDVKKINELNLNVEIVFHLGMYSSSPMYRENPHFINEVVEGAISIMEYTKKHSSDLVFASSSSVYSGIKPPHKEGVKLKVTDFYTEGRIAVERIAELYSKLYKINATGLRLFSIYGKHEESKGVYANLISQFLWSIKKNEEPVVYGDGTQKRDFVYVDDVVEAFVTATKSKRFNIFNVGMGKNYTINEMIEILNKNLNKNVKAKYIKMPVKNYVYETLADTAKAEGVLEFKARYSLEEGISKLISS